MLEVRVIDIVKSYYLKENGEEYFQVSLQGFSEGLETDNHSISEGSFVVEGKGPTMDEAEKKAYAEFRLFVIRNDKK